MLILLKVVGRLTKYIPINEIADASNTQIPFNRMHVLLNEMLLRDKSINQYIH